MKTLRLGIACFAILLLSGCATSAKKGCLDEWKSRYPNLTKEQQLALFYGAKGVGCIPEWYLKTEKDKAPEIDYKKIPLDKVLTVNRKMLNDLDDILDPKNERWFKLMEETGLRSYFEGKERALKFRAARIELYLNHLEFRKLMGEIDSSPSDERYRKGYHVNLFLPDFDQNRDTPFTAKYLNEAKQSGKLVWTGKTIIFDYELLGKKDPDPEFLSDPNKFIWKERVEGLEIDMFKIMDSPKPQDKRGSYLEAIRVVFTLSKTGEVLSTKRESKPALRIFASQSDQLDIAVIDMEREGELGFGLPNLVEKLATGILSGQDLYLNHRVLLSKIFEEKTAKKRWPFPTIKAQKVEIAAAGTPVNPWEKNKSSQGWQVPYNYKTEKQDNYTLEIILKPKKPGDTSLTWQINFIRKVYHAPGNVWQSVKGDVVEYYRPKSEFAVENILEARTDYVNKKKLMIEREGQPSVSGIVAPGKNIFVDDKPFAADYTEGESRWRIADRDKSGLLEYRMEISNSSSDESEDSSK